MGRDSSVGIATRYGLDGPGIESRYGANFTTPVQTGPGAHPASCTMVNGSFPGVKRPGRGAEHPPPSKRRGLKKGRAIPLLTLWATVACYREHLLYHKCDKDRSVFGARPPRLTPATNRLSDDV